MISGFRRGVYENCALLGPYAASSGNFILFLIPEDGMWCWWRMEKISWTDHVRNEEVLLRVNEQRNILHEIRKRKANWIGHILRRNCLLKQAIEGKIKGEMEVARRRGRRCRNLLDDLKDRRGYSHLKEEALDRTMWRNHFGGGFGPVVWQNTEWMNECSIFYGTKLPKFLTEIPQNFELVCYVILHLVSHMGKTCSMNAGQNMC